MVEDLAWIGVETLETTTEPYYEWQGLQGENSLRRTGNSAARVLSGQRARYGRR